MRKIINICDVCKDEEIVQYKDEAKHLPIKIIIGSRGQDVVYESSIYAKVINLSICEECQKKLCVEGSTYTSDLAKKDGQKETDARAEFFEKLCEMLEDAGFTRE